MNAGCLAGCLVAGGIRIGHDFSFNIERSELQSFGNVTINGTDVDTIRWYNQHDTLCSFQARDDIANLKTEDIEINQRPLGSFLGFILQIVHHNMTSIDIDFIIELVSFIDPARIETLVRAQLDFHEVTGELGMLLDNHCAQLRPEMFCPNGIVVRRIVYVESEATPQQIEAPCYSLIAMGNLQFPVPANFVKKGLQTIVIRTLPMNKLPWLVTCSEMVVQYILGPKHKWMNEIPSTTAFVVEYQVEDERLKIEFHPVSITGMTTAAQILNAHNLIQPEEGWTLFTDKNGQELVPECRVDVGDTIGVIDNIKPTIKTNDDISPTIPYQVAVEPQGSRPVQTDRIGECYQKIASLVENFIFATVGIPLHIADNESYSRIWKTVHHGPPIAFDEMQYYIQLLAHEASCTCIGAMSCSDLFTATALSAIATRTTERNLMAVLVAHHWRILLVDGLELRWCYSCTGLELHHEITTMINQLLPHRFESQTHLGSGVQGWCGWDALEAWMEFQNVKIAPETEQINPPLHQQVPAQWNTYHEKMTQHPIFSTQELGLILRTKWFKRIFFCLFFLSQSRARMEALSVT